MKRVSFGSDGKLVGVDGKVLGKKRQPIANSYMSSGRGVQRQSKFDEERDYREENGKLVTSEDLDFLKEEKPEIENIFEKDYWSLYDNGKALEPLRFSNGKSQEDIVRDVVELIEKGKKVIFLHGVCGTGKSAIALNIARVLGKSSIVVPIKSLQKQYEKDYMGDKYVLNKKGVKMKIAMITGRDNHASIIEEGQSCAYPFLPDTIKLTEKNIAKLKQFYRDNPYINNNSMPSVKGLKRIAIAPANPYWSPILPAEIEIKHFKDAKKKRYMGMNDREFIFYHRKKGCSYYDQYLSYIDSDVIIFNSAKYLAEVAIGRKPQTEVDIIDEADEFLDSFANTKELNITFLKNALKMIVPDNLKTQENIKKIGQLIDLEETNKRVLGVDEEKVYHINDTKIADILSLFSNDKELEVEIEMDDTNYANSALEAARDFQESFKDTYLTYRKEDDNLFVKLVTTNLSKKFKEIVEGNKALVLMSGTLHSDEVLKHVFGIEDYARVEAETLNQGAIEIMMTGKEFDCKYSNFRSGGKTPRGLLESFGKSC
jgi:Rad3-related DNA helicase